MLDTVAFNRIVENDIDVELLMVAANEYYVTHIQRDEILRCEEPKRSKLLKIFTVLTMLQIPTESAVLDVSRMDEAKVGGDRMVPTESAVWGVSCWGQCNWTSDDNLFQPIVMALDKIKKKKSNLQDALIAETSIKNGFTLVTDDRGLHEVLPKYNAKVIYFDVFLAYFKK